MADSEEQQVSSTSPLFNEEVHHYQAEPDPEPQQDHFDVDDIVDLVGGAQDALERHIAEDSAPHEFTETSFPEPEPEIPDSTTSSPPFVPEPEPQVVAPKAEPEITKIAPEPEPAPVSDALPAAEPRTAAPAPAEAAERPAVTEEPPAPAACEYLFGGFYVVCSEFGETGFRGCFPFSRFCEPPLASGPQRPAESRQRAGGMPSVALTNFTRPYTLIQPKRW
uniref:Uncharacterized protein n=1 Tax=Stegastes partitus TaxID=144197 RepID=A0A3B5BBJ5_9TELE